MFDEAWIEGVDSAPFRRNVLTIAQRIISVASDIDAALANSEEQEAGNHNRSVVRTLPLTEVDEEEVDEADGLIELSDAFTNELSKMTEDAGPLAQAISDLGDIPQMPAEAKSSPRAASKYLIRVAEKMKQPSLVIDARGQSLFQAAKRSDGLLRSLLRTARLSGSSDLIAQVYGPLSEGVKSLSEIESVGGQLEGLLESMKTPEALSASIRRAVKPARQGIVAVQDAIGLITDWPDLIETLNDSVE